MTIFRRLCGGLVLLIAAPAAWSEPAADPVRGYLDPTSGVFTAFPSQQRTSVVTLSRTEVKGTLKIVATVAVAPSIPKQSAIQASAQISLGDASTANAVSVSGPVKRAGDKGTITFSVPYDWYVGKVSDTLSITFSVVTADYTTVESLTEHLPLPADGATTVIRIGEAL